MNESVNNTVQPLSNGKKLRYHNYLYECERIPNKMDLAKFISTAGNIEDVLKNVQVHCYEGDKNYFIIKIFTHHPFVFDNLNFCNKYKCKFIKKGFNKNSNLKELLEIDFDPIGSS